MVVRSHIHLGGKSGHPYKIGDSFDIRLNQGFFKSLLGMHPLTLAGVDQETNELLFLVQPKGPDTKNLSKLCTPPHDNSPYGTFEGFKDDEKEVKTQISLRPSSGAINRFLDGKNMDQKALSSFMRDWKEKFTPYNLRLHVYKNKRFNASSNQMPQNQLHKIINLNDHRLMISGCGYHAVNETRDIIFKNIDLIDGYDLITY